MPFEQPLKYPEKSEALKKAEKADAELAARLSKKEMVNFPGPPTVNPEIAEIERDWRSEGITKPGEIVKLPEKIKPKESRKKAA